MKPIYDYVIYHKRCLDGFTGFIILTKTKLIKKDAIIFPDVPSAKNIPPNINGKNIKVIIISKSGTEGLDFKFIRQVHIMEPWYNMNLIEQTIGRAVRNCSHKDLPFEKRNVQIYLHGSILTSKPEEEAADRKAIDAYFEENPQALVNHHIESYNDFFQKGIYQIEMMRQLIQC